MIGIALNKSFRLKFPNNVMVIVEVTPRPNPFDHISGNAVIESENASSACVSYWPGDRKPGENQTTDITRHAPGYGKETADNGWGLWWVSPSAAQVADLIAWAMRIQKHHIDHWIAERKD